MVLWAAATARVHAQTVTAPNRERTESDAGPDRLAGSLAEILKGSGDLTAFRLRLDWVSGEDVTSVAIHGDGIGIWKNASQFRLTRPELLSLVRSVQEAGVGAMRPQYGDDESDRLTFRGKLTVAVGPAAKRVVQLVGGEQSETFADLANRIVALAEKKASAGVGATSLSDGLRKLADGTLAPEAFDLVFQRRDDRPVPAPEDGWLLRLRGRDAVVRVFRPTGGYGTPRRRVLQPREFGDLLAALRQSDPDAFGPGLFATRYTDLQIRVLNWSKDVQARRYLGVTPETHGQVQRAFDRLSAELDQIARNVAAQGREAPETD